MFDKFVLSVQALTETKQYTSTKCVSPENSLAKWAGKYIWKRIGEVCKTIILDEAILISYWHCVKLYKFNGLKNKKGFMVQFSGSDASHRYGWGKIKILRALPLGDGQK